MAQTTTTPTPRKRPGILRILLIVTAVLLALLVAAFFYLTSASFVKGTVLPKAGAALDSDITVSEVAIHPFRSVTFRDLKLTPRGRETLLTELHQRIRDVRQGPDGMIYVLTDEDDGALLRIEPAS